MTRSLRIVISSMEPSRSRQQLPGAGVIPAMIDYKQATGTCHCISIGFYLPLKTRTHIIYTTMTILRGILSRRLAISIIALAAIALLSPNSTYVLCITPDGHMEVESIVSGCCASPGVSGSLQNEKNEFRAADDCTNCQDFFITPTDRGSAFHRSFSAPVNSPAAESAETFLPTHIVSFASATTSTNGNTAASVPILSSPLRC